MLHRSHLSCGALTFAALLLAGCAAPTLQGASSAPRQAPSAATGEVEWNLENLYRGGRLAELGARIDSVRVDAEKRAPSIIGLLTAAEGRALEGLSYLERARPSAGQAASPAEDRCLPLHIAFIQLYQRGDAEAARKMIEQAPGERACGGEAEQRLIGDLRERLRLIDRRPIWQVSGPQGEHVIVLDRISASLGYLVARVIFDREHSGHFIVSTSVPDLVLSRALASELGLSLSAPLASLGDGLSGAEVREVQAAVLPQIRVGLLWARNVPALVADLEVLREKFQKRISRGILIDGFLPIARLLQGGYFRLVRRGTELVVATSGERAGPCRFKHPFRARLYQIDGLLGVEGGLPGSPPLLLRLALEQRMTALRGSALKYARDPSALVTEKAGSDVARPVITEPEARERLRDATIRLGEAGLMLRHVPLLPSRSEMPGRPQPQARSQPVDHGVVGTDLLSEFDAMVDLGEGQIYLAPHGSVSCPAL